MEDSDIRFYLKVLVVAFFAAELMPYVFYMVSAKNQQQSQYNMDLIATLNWIRNNTPSDAIFMHEWGDAHPVVGIADRRVIAASKANPSEVPMIAERYKDLARFFFSTNSSDALKIAQKYNATYVLLDKSSFNYNTCWYIGVCESFMMNEGISNATLNTFLFSRMQNVEFIPGFQIVYESQNFVIYKVAA